LHDQCILHAFQHLEGKGSGKSNESEGNGGGNSIAGTSSVAHKEVSRLVIAVEVDFEDVSSVDCVPSGGEVGGGVAGSVDQRSVGGGSTVVGASRFAVTVEVDAVFHVQVTTIAVGVVWEVARVPSSSNNGNVVGASGIVEVVEGSGHFNGGSFDVEDVQGVIAVG